MNRASTESVPVVTFVPFPPHDRASDARSHGGGALATVSSLPVRAVTAPSPSPSRRQTPEPMPKRAVLPPVPVPVPAKGTSAVVGRTTPGVPCRRRVATSELLCRYLHGLRGRVRQRFTDRQDAGMSTAEYAIGTVAACGLAALLYKVLTSDAVREALTELLNRALHAA